MHLPHLLGRRVLLKPGEYFVSKQQVVISTLLGSCVAACLWDEPNKVVGMNHFLLANRRYARYEPLYRTEAGRYGVQAMELLINGMTKLGARRENLRAKVFGGASVMKAGDGDNFSCVGEVNTRFIVEFLVTDGIPLVSADLGGNVGRVIYFSSQDFSVHMRKMGRTRQKMIAQTEKGFWNKATEKESAAPAPEIWL